ncbi:MAG: YqzE family protein [Tuberibacillus sp.]
MKSDDYVKWLTEQFVQYMNQPRNVRKDKRELRKKQRNPIKNEMFGLIPNAISHYAKQLKNTRVIPKVWRKQQQ